MPNLKGVIQYHNPNLLLNHTTPVAGRLCSCRQKLERPLNNESLSKSLVYKGAVLQTPSQLETKRK